MKTVEWTALALEDAADIDRYLWPFSPDRSEFVIDRIDSATRFLAEAPMAGPEIEEGRARKWSVRGTDYLIVYRVRPDGIEVLRVRHGRENWRDGF